MRLSGDRQIVSPILFLALLLWAYFTIIFLRPGQCTPHNATNASKTAPQKPTTMSQPGRVPKVVHQTWKSTTPPSPYREWRQECIDLNPDWEFKIWTDDDNRELVRLHYPSLLSTYDNYDVNIKRIDSARYMMLHRYGGVYMDLDITCLRPFGNTFDTTNTFYAAEQHSLANLAVENAHGRRENRVANAFMASSANHAFLTNVFTKLPHTSSDHVLSATGPIFLTTMLQQDDYNLSSVLVFPMEIVYCQDWEIASTGKGCRNITSCRAKCPDALTVSFWTHSWK
jgi:inositol phosphorylceramide mannosyltransferase catalytic subunit